MENPETPVVENPETPTPEIPVAPAFTWKSNLPVDYVNSPSMQKFSDDKEGIVKVAESYLNLEKLLGHNKVPLPKDENDAAGIAIFNKALGIPDKPEGYNLQDAAIPENIKNIVFDKKAFAEQIHKLGLTPKQAQGAWKAYTEMSLGAYNKAITDHQNQLADLVNTLRGKWGDAYDSNVELGQMVINKFSDSQETNDWITVNILKDPRGAEFLAKIGGQFAENKIGDFKYQRFALTPDQAQQEIDKILNDKTHPYNNEKAIQEEHDKAVEYVNSLYIVANKKQQ